MKDEIKMLAFDFGASSGRAILGTLQKDKLELEEIHRFSNDPVEVNGSLYWDVLRLFYEIKQGILKCVQKGHKDIASIAVDTWGVDFGLLDGQGKLLGNPYHYRDSRTHGMQEKISAIIPKEELYKKTGIEFMWFNTILQLYSMKYHNSPQLKEADSLLLMPDLFNYFLTGRKTAEYSIASTTQLMDACKRNWSDDILDRLGLDRKLFAEIIQPGTVVGLLSSDIAKELGVPQVKVIATASHDTQAAVASVPAEGEDFVYISSGTWSLVGIEAEKPVLSGKSHALSFTNEGGVGGKITLLKNIMGMWLVQECKRQWEKDGKVYSFAELEEMARDSKAFVSFIDPDHLSFVAPGNMPERIREFCHQTGQPVPGTVGEMIRCISQSLAMKYRMTVENLEELQGKLLPVIHMVGGGIKDRLLCQLTSDITERIVKTGPVEATSIGNLMVQAMALGKVGNLHALRQVVKRSFPITEFKPQKVEGLGAAYERYKQIISFT